MNQTKTFLTWRTRLQLGFIHLAVAMTLVPINSTLNRVMIKEWGISAALVATLVSFPFLLSPMQMFLGAYADQHPWRGWHRTPYILLGMALCVLGVVVAPHAALLLAKDLKKGIIPAILAFGAWGLGYNIATVAYFALAGEGSEPSTRGQTVATMMTMMVLGIIATAVALSRMLEPYTYPALTRAFLRVGMVAGALGLLGLWKLEPRRGASRTHPEQKPRATWKDAWRLLVENPRPRAFFIYLVLLLTALLAQDVLLEPFAAEAFGMPVHMTTRITAIWGGCFLFTLVAGGWLERRFAKPALAQTGNLTALAGFVGILVAGMLAHVPLFYAGLVLLGCGTGLSTVANMSLMFDLTLPGQVGLYMGAWGMASAFARWFGSISGGLIRDLAIAIAGDPIWGYLLVFGLEAGLLALAASLLPGLNLSQRSSPSAAAEPPGIWERATLSD